MWTVKIIKSNQVMYYTRIASTQVVMQGRDYIYMNSTIFV